MAMPLLTQPVQPLTQATIPPAAAIALLDRVVEAWGLQKKYLPPLLGHVAGRTIRDWRTTQRNNPLDRDVVERISHLLAIYDATHRLFGDPDFANAWISQAHPAFGRQSPKALLLSGSMTALIAIRAYLDRALSL